MEISFIELKEREVINVEDGKSYGRVTDMVFTYPEGRVQGIMVPGKKGFNLFKSCPDIFIDFRRIRTIGDDVILVDMRKAPPKPPHKHDREPGKDDGVCYDDLEDY